MNDAIHRMLAQAMLGSNAAPLAEPSLWEKLKALFTGEQPQPRPDALPHQYLPNEMMPQDAVQLQRSKEEILRKAMMGEQ